MTKYKVIVSKHIAENMLEHTSFIANVSVDAAKRFVSEFEKVVTLLEDNPLQFQVDTSFANPDGYRRVIFAKWYKCLFLVKDSTVFVDSIVDCRKYSE